MMSSVVERLCGNTWVYPKGLSGASSSSKCDFSDRIDSLSRANARRILWNRDVAGSCLSIPLSLADMRSRDVSARPDITRLTCYPW